MKQPVMFLIIVSIMPSFLSCTKPGTGGKATLVVFPQHNGKAIMNHTGYPDTVFLKFNVKELPGLHAGDYDTYFIGTAGEDHVNCTGLKPGQYYLFGVGFDSTGNIRVAGGMSYKLKYKDRKNETNVNLSVTE